MFLSVLFLHPLGPALLLACGGILAEAAGRLAWRIALARRRPDAPPPRTVISYSQAIIGGFVLAATLLLTLQLANTPAAAILRWTWQPLTVAGSVHEWRLDGWSWLAMMAILLIGIAALALENVEALTTRQPTSQIGRTLWLCAAALAFVTAGNVMALATAWVLLDAALALRLGPDRSQEPAGRAWSLLSSAAILLLLLLTVLGEKGIKTSLTAGPFGGVEWSLLWLLALIRAGIYPLHFWLLPSGRAGAIGYGRAVGLHLIAPAAGIWLVGRVHGTAPAEWLRRPEWAALAALALLGTALAAWAAEDEEQRWRWIALNRASLAVMAAYTATATGPQSLAWALVSLSLGLSLLAVGRLASVTLGWRWPLWVAAVALWGPPGAPGFLARSVLIYPTELPVALPLFGIVLLAEVLLVAALWQDVTRIRAVAMKHRRPIGVLLGLAIAGMTVPLLTWGLAPDRLANLAGFSAPNLPAAIFQARRSVWVGLLASGLGGMALGILRPRIFNQMRGWQAALIAIVSLEWLDAIAAGMWRLIGSVLRYFAVLGEGEGYLGWLALAGVILWVLLVG